MERGKKGETYVEGTLQSHKKKGGDVEIGGVRNNTDGSVREEGGKKSVGRQREQT